MLNNQLAASEWDDNLVSQSSAERLSSPLRCLRNGKNSRRCFFYCILYVSVVTSGILWTFHHKKNLPEKHLLWQFSVSALLVFSICHWQKSGPPRRKLGFEPLSSLLRNRCEPNSSVDQVEEKRKKRGIKILDNNDW